MKILLDECLPRRLAGLLIGYEVITVPQAGWAGLKNGKLLTVAQEEFDVFITIDQNLTAQQNTSKYNISIVVVKSSSNNIEYLKPLVPKILDAISECSAGSVHKVFE